MYAGRGAGKGSLSGSSQKIALELEGGEVLRAIRQIGKRTVATGRIGQGNDDRGVQVSVETVEKVGESSTKLEGCVR